MSAGTSLLDAAALPPAASLDQLVGAAALQTRVDRKYFVEPDLLVALVAAHRDRLRALDIAGRRCFAYESVYFDTPQLASYRSAATGRRRRFKVRTRTYLDSGECVLEVKRQGGRGETAKARLPYSGEQRRALDGTACRFVDALVASAVGTEPVAPRLRPVLTTTYRRATFADLDAGWRMTCDADLVCRDVDGGAVGLDGLVLVETKSAATPTVVDRWLWRHGRRPESVSKFCVGLAALRPELPANKWHRTLSRHFSGAVDAA